MKPQEPRTLEPTPICGSCGHPHRPGDPCTAARLAGAGTGTLAMDPSDGTGGDGLRAVDPLVGSTVGSFRVVRALGRGGMGTVYLAEHPVIGSRVAIKFLHESMAASPELVARFYDEARAVNRIGHENIVGIFDLSMLPPNRYYIVMEYLDGDALSALLRGGSLQPGEALAILLQLCDALQCAHERGVVHRDLKPDNVFVLRRRGAPFVKLLDFGIAKLRDAPPGAQTAAGLIVGTPEYMAPEQCENRPIDARTDVYALGVMAYQMFAGVLPFTGTITQLLLAHVHEEPRPPRSVNGLLPPALEDAILRALRKRPEDRFPDMAAFAAALAEGREAAPRRPQGPAPAAERSLVLRVQLAGESQARSCPAGELTRGGVYLEAGPPLPAPFSRAVVSVPDGGSGATPVPAEVVRVVQPAEASAWGMAAGFALQFLPGNPAERAALERLAGGAPSPHRPEASDESAAALIEALEGHSHGTHYEFLGLPPDAELKEVQSRARALRVQLENLRGRKLSPRHASLVAPLLARVAFAGDVIGVAAERLAYDAGSGNHLGVARCIAAGLPDALVAQRRQEFLRARPGAEERARQCHSRAKVARAVGNLAFARAQYEEALAADPLDLDIHREYWALRRDLEGTGTMTTHRTVLVTGATSGFGEATAERFARDGARLVLAGRRADRLEALARRLSSQAPVHPLVLDVRDRPAVERALSTLPADFAGVDVLVNSAGLALGLEPAQRASLDDWDQMIDTNARGLVLVTRQVLPGMVERGRGHVVNVGSVAGTYPYPGGNVYGATKAFVHQFSLNLRADLVGSGVRVTCVEPGMAETEFSLVRLKDAGKAHAVYQGVTPLSGADVADAIHWVVTRPPHVNVNVLELMPEQQAFSPFAVKRRPPP